MGKSISFLLGAGFSAPMGYPQGKKLGDLIINVNNNIVSNLEKNPNYLYDGFNHILKVMIDYYKTSHNNNFDYEDFYEYIKPYCKDKQIGPQLNNYRNIKQIPIENMGDNYKESYLRFVCDFIKDGENKQFYKEYDWTQLKKYERFIKVLKVLLDKDYELNIHTLNHDLLFESFKNSPIIGNEICDGFDCQNDIYKGHNDRNDLVTLPYYNGVYDKKIRLFKLHGSIDYYKYYTGGCYMLYDTHIRIKETINKSKELYKYENGKKIDTFRFLDLRPDYLTGIESKEKDYNKPLYNRLLPIFEENLRNAKCLIIIGYGGKDEGINNRIINNLHSPCFIYDLYLNDNLKMLLKKVDTVKNFQKRNVVKFKLPKIINF